MIPVYPDRAQRASDLIALFVAASLFCLTLFAHPFIWTDQTAPVKTDQAVQLSVESAVATPAPPAPPPPVPRPLPKHRELTRVAPTAAPTPPDPIPVSDQPVPEGATVVAAVTPAVTSAAPAAPNADLEAQYAEGLRADIGRRTRPPDSPEYRRHRVTGEVHVRFVVTRSGEAKEVQVTRSSGFSILDQAAQAIVAAGHYPPMPAMIFVNEKEHVFGVTIDFSAAIQAARNH